MDLNAILNKAIYEISVEDAAKNAAAAVDAAHTGQVPPVNMVPEGTKFSGGHGAAHGPSSDDPNESLLYQGKVWADQVGERMRDLYDRGSNYVQDVYNDVKNTAGAYADQVRNDWNNSQNVLDFVQQHPGLSAGTVGIPAALLAGAGALALRRRQRAAQGLK